MKHDFKSIVEAPTPDPIFVDLVRALDAVKNNKLVAGQYGSWPYEDVCAWGALAIYNNSDSTALTKYSGWWYVITTKNDRFKGSPSERWAYMHEWALRGGK